MSRCPKIIFSSLAVLALSACNENEIQECTNTFQDEKKQSIAYAYCEKAANSGDAKSQFYFAELLLKTGDKKQAVSFLEKSASSYALARTRLGELYENGDLADDKERTSTRFYYEKACEMGEMKGCQKANLLSQQRQNQENAQKHAETEKRRKEEERLQKERETFEAQKAEEEKRLAAERKKLEEQKRQNKVENLFISQKSINDTFDSVVDTVKKEKSLKEWVENCYARSKNKLGCFHYDQWVSLVLEQIAKENNEDSDPYFGDSRIRNRALRNIPELQNITTAQFNRIVADAREKLQDRASLFWQKLDKANEIPSQSTSSNTSRVNTSSLTFNEGLAKYEQNGLWGFVDKQGNIVIRPQFQAVGGFYNGRATVQVANKNWGYIDKQGNWVISPQYCMAGRFSEGLAGVYVGGYRSGDDCVGGKWGYITPSGKMAINAVLDRAWAFTKEKGKAAKAKVIYNGHTGYINGKGEWVD